MTLENNLNKVVEEKDDFEKKYADNRYRQLDSLKNQLEWIKRQLEYVEFSRKYTLKMEVHRGEIYEFDFGENVNAEFSHRHYGLVLKDSKANDPIVLVCPLKTNKKGIHPLSDVDLGVIESLRTDHSTIAVINQTRALDKMRIFTKSAIGEKDFYIDKIPVLDEKRTRLVLTAFYNYLFCDLFK